MSSRTLYFGFGSNMWKQQMSHRCPASTYVGIGRLRGYEWFINSRGYANIAPSAKDNGVDSRGPDDPRLDSEVWGLVYELTPDDEASLDINEGAPYIYEKQTIPVEFWPARSSSSASTAEALAAEAGKAVPMLVYIDTRHNRGGYPPRDEYVHRMNAGIHDALEEGVPASYVRQVLRKYIPPAEGKEKAEEGKNEAGVITELEADEELPERASEVCYAKYYGF
ncbi:hypothetical protein VTH82DRAFT_7863 [Thermothelomyces myriococcoides]